MKKLLLFLSLFAFTMSSIGTQAQLINDAANFGPTTTWTVTGAYTALGFTSDPTVNATFAFSDDDAGNGNTDNIAAESAVIDLSPAFGTENLITVDAPSYSYRALGGSTFNLEYWDADGSTWIVWESIVDNYVGGDGNLCDAGTYTSPELDISSFTATQQSGFRYRFAYDDAAGWQWGFCMGSPTITSAAPPACTAPASLVSTPTSPTTTDLTWTGAGNMIVEYGPLGFTPGTDGTAGGGTIATSIATSPYTLTLPLIGTYDIYVRQDCGTPLFSTNTFAGTFVSPPANDECAGATALTVNADLMCGSTTAGTIAAATASAEDATACFGTENDDVWFSFVATATSHAVDLLNLTGGTTDLYHSLWEGTCGTLTQIGTCSDPNNSTQSGLTIGNTYYLRVYSWTSTAGQTTSFDVCIGTLPAAPANDDCAGATALTVNADLLCGSTTAGTIASATASAEDAATCNGTENDDVWFSFVATATSHAVDLLNLTGGTTDLYHSLWEGTCGTLTQIGTCSDPNSSTQSGLTIGNTYYLRVYSWTSTAGQTTSFDVCIGTNTAPPLANDLCAGAIPITPSAAGTGCGAATFNLPFSTDGTTDSGVPAVCSDPGLDQWFTWTATSTGLSWNDQAPGNPGIAIFASCADANAGSEIVCSGTFADALLSGWNIGDVLLIQIYDFAGSSSDVAFCLEEYTPPAAPANDECVAATALTVNADLLCGSTTAGTIASATASAEDAVACSGTEDDDVWFSFVATATSHTVDLLNITGGTTDLYHSLWEGTCGALTLVPSTCSDPNSSSPAGLTIGNTYYLRVYSWTSTTGQTSAFDVCIGTLPPAPANDEISGAIAVTCGSVTSGQTASATQGTDESGTCGTGVTAPGVWYTITGTGGPITASLCGASYDTRISIYTGTSGSLVCVDGNDDTFGGLCGSTASAIEFSTTAGTTYLILVNGFSNNTGTFDLAITCDAVWTGTTSTAWNIATNWYGDVLPTLPADNVFIPSAGVTNFPLIIPAITLGDITVDVGASLTVTDGIVLDGTFTNNGTVTLLDGAFLDDYSNPGTASYIGDITVERFVSNGTGNDQRFISSAVDAPPVSEIGDDLSGPWGLGLPGTDGVAVTIDDCALQTTTPTSNYGNLFEFNETLIATCGLDGWVVRSAGNLANGAGYSAYLTSGSTFDLTGFPNTGDVNVAVTNSGAGAALNEGWNMVGNPYPSSISRDDIITANAADIQYYVASGPYQGSFAAYMPTSNIAIGQGFQMFTPANATLTFTDGMRRTSNSTWYNTGAWFEHKLEVSVFGDNGADKTILFYNNDASSNYEAMYDVNKRDSDLGNPTLSTFSANKNLALNGLNITNLGETVPMNLKAGTDGNFSLKFEGLETFGNTTIYVKDLQENVVHNIANGDYAFTSTTSDNEGRFEIIFVPEVNFTATKVDCDMNDANLSLTNFDFVANRTFELLANNVVVNTGNLTDLNTVDLEEGIYTLNVADQFGGSQNYDVVIESAEMIEANLTVSNTEVFVGEMISLNNTTTNSDAVVWNLSNSTIGTVNNLTYTFDEAGTYEIEMMVSNNECSDAKVITVEVASKTTAIETVNGSVINLYPNPATTVLNIETDVDVVVEMVSILGKTILSTSNKQISLENVSAGVYFIKIYDTNNKLIGSEKVIKK